MNHLLDGIESREARELPATEKEKERETCLVIVQQRHHPILTGEISKLGLHNWNLSLFSPSLILYGGIMKRPFLDSFTSTQRILFIYNLLFDF